MMTPQKNEESISGILSTGPVIAKSYGRWLGVIVILFAISRHHRRLPIFIGTVLAAVTAKISGLF